MDTEKLVTPKGDRIAWLKGSTHLRAQIKRVMEPLTMIQGTANVMDFEQVVNDVAFAVAALEVNPEMKQTHGLVMVVRNPASGYSLYLNAGTVYDIHLTLEEDD